MAARTGFVILFSILFFLKLAGQQYDFVNYGLDHGLPQSSIFCIHHDSRGYVWVGTESGVSRFNGIEFETFDKNSGLPGNSVRGIAETNDGRIWVGTENGIAYLQNRNWIPVSPFNNDAALTVTKLVIDHHQRIWVATNEAGLYVIESTPDSLKFTNINSSKGLSSDFVLDVLHVDKDAAWIAMIGGLNVVRFVNDSIEITNVADSALLPSLNISCLASDSKGEIFFGTLDAGVYSLKKHSKGYAVAPFGRQAGITDTRIWSLFIDEYNAAWVGTNEQGLFYIHNNQTLQLTADNGLPGNLVYRIFQDDGGNLWLGTMNGLSLFRGFKFVHYTEKSNLPGNFVLSVKSSSDSALWLGTDGGLSKYRVDNNKLVGQPFRGAQSVKNQVISMDFDGDGNLLAGTRGGGLAIINNTGVSFMTSSQGLSDNNINCVYRSDAGSIYIGTNLGYNEIADNRIYTITEENGLIHPEVQTIVSDALGNIWMGTMGGLVKYTPATGQYRDYDEQEGLADLRVHSLALDIHNRVYIGTVGGLYRIETNGDTIVYLAHSQLKPRIVNSLLFYNDTTLIAGTQTGIKQIVFNADLTHIQSVITYEKSDGFAFGETSLNAISKDVVGRVWIGTVSGLTCYRPEIDNLNADIPQVHITGVRLSFNAVDWLDLGYTIDENAFLPQKLILPYDENHVSFDFDGVFYPNPERVKYRYKLIPSEKQWSPSSENPYVTYPGLVDGKYEFAVSASVDGLSWSEPVVYNFVITPPFWKTTWFAVSVIAVLAMAIFFYIKFRERKLRKEKEHLEQVVKERTAEVVQQRDRIEAQHKIVTLQKHEITSSINYASRIQQAVLPGAEILKESTTDSFILYKPRDIVSGDFYWIGRRNHLLIVAAADCTGHGVPGAFMSMLGISFMNKIINEQNIYEPHTVLNEMRNNVITSLQQGNYDGSTKDGMDMALCVVDLNTLEMNFSGAYNPAIIMTEGEPIEMKSNRMPVGLHIVMNDFEAETIQLKKGDTVYLFSDGFQDQIGGPKGRKFMKKQLRELIVEIHKKPGVEQLQFLTNTIQQWMNPGNGEGYEQIDDICVIGFKV